MAPMHDIIRECVIPSLATDLYKGQAGRVGVVGGCDEYTGAPYFAAMSALRVGADLSHVFCSRGAATVIKTFSPELIVHPYLEEAGPGEADPEAVQRVAAKVGEWLSRLDCLVVGPGLGRDPLMLDSARAIIELAKKADIAIVIDADGLFIINQTPAVIAGYAKAVVTPNLNEFSRMLKHLNVEVVEPTEWEENDILGMCMPSAELHSVVQTLGGVTVVQKGAIDCFSNGRYTAEVSHSGSLRRCGGQGDLLAGSLAVFYAWALAARDKAERNGDSIPAELAAAPGVVAAYAACSLVRNAAAATFRVHHRAMVAGDIIPQLGPTFELTYPSGN